MYAGTSNHDGGWRRAKALQIHDDGDGAFNVEKNLLPRGKFDQNSNANDRNHPSYPPRKLNRLHTKNPH